MAPQFTLYGNVASITSDRVRLMLADQGFTDYEFVNLDFLKGEQKVCLSALLHLTFCLFVMV
jgi:hypothetical protein